MVDKWCPRCEKHKLTTEFYTHGGTEPSGWCKQCRREDERRRRADPALSAAYRKKHTTDMNFRAMNILRGIKKRAKRRGLECDLDMEWMTEKFAGNCDLTGIAFDCGVKMLMPSVDRIDAYGSYTKTNCRMTLMAVNLALNQWGLEAFLPIAEALVARQKRSKAA